MEPAAAPGGFGGGAVLEVAGEKAPARIVVLRAQQQFARFAARQFIAVVVGDAVSSSFS